MFRIPVRLGLMLVLSAAFATSVAAQALPDWNPSRPQLSRAELQDLLSRLEQTAQSSAYSKELRTRAEKEADLVRERLEFGDFRVGDQLWLHVQGEEALQDTFVVATDRVLNLPAIGAVPVRGILRQELQAHMTTELGRYIRNPVVRAEPLLRLSVKGQVATPGFFVVPTTQLLTEFLMFVGGPNTDANIEEIRVEREGHVIWDGDALQRAMTEGRTLDQLSLQAGDQVVVPQQRSQSVLRSIVTSRYFITAVLGLIGIGALR